MMFNGILLVGRGGKFEKHDPVRKWLQVVLVEQKGRIGKVV